MSVATTRPMTGNRAAGYSSAGFQKRKIESVAMPKTSTAAALLKSSREPSAAQKLVLAEKDCNDAVTASCVLAKKGDLRGAIDKAKDAYSKVVLIERSVKLGKLPETSQSNIGVTVRVNLASVMQFAKEYNDAIKYLNEVLEDDTENYRFRLNIGHVYYEQKRFSDAIKSFRIALDRIGENEHDLRIRLLRAIGHSFFSMRAFPDAIENYKAILATPIGIHDRCTALNLLLCHYAKGDKEAMKNLFEQMCKMKVFRDTDFPVDTRRKGLNSEFPSPSRSGHGTSSPHRAKDGAVPNLFEEMMNDEEFKTDANTYTFSFPNEDPITGQQIKDHLKEELVSRRRRADRYLILAGKLIAPIIERTPELGYEWVKEMLMINNASASVVTEARLAKAAHYLRKKDFESAVRLFKEFQDLDPEYQALAATNLSFLAFLEDKLEEADRFADMAVKADRYNAHALVNKGICLYKLRNQYTKAKELFLEAIGVEADCVEAIYNLGLVNKDCGVEEQDPMRLHEALQAFEKLHSILPGFADALYQLAQVNELLGNNEKAIEWYSKLLSSKVRPNDGVASQRLAALHARMEDPQQAVARYTDAFRANPTNCDVAVYLGVHYVRNEEFDTAIPFFRRAAEVQPDETKWQLMIASCLRRTGDIDQALQMYEEIHTRFPRDKECLRFLVILCQDKGLNCEEYKDKLAILQQDEQTYSLPPTSQQQSQIIPQQQHQH